MKQLKIQIVLVACVGLFLMRGACADDEPSASESPDAAASATATEPASTPAAEAAAAPDAPATPAEQEADPSALPENEETVHEAGQDDLDEAMRLRVTSEALDEGRLTEGLRDLNRVVELLQSALDKGLDPANQAFAEELLSDSLMERANSLMEVLRRRPATDPRMAQLQRMAASDLRSVLAAPNPPPIARLMLAQLQASPEGDVHEAKRLLGQFLAEKEVPDDERAEALALRARLQSTREKALSDFDEAIRLAPDDATLTLARAAYLRGQNEPEQALAEVTAMLAKNPEDPATLLLQGEILRELGRLDDALAAFDQAVKLAPQMLEAYQNRGEIYRRQEDYKRAIKEFTMVLQMRPGVLLTLLHRAEAYLLDDNSKAALADVEAALAQQPGLVAAHRLRAQALAGEERLGEAIEEMQQIAEALPEDIDVRMQLAVYYRFNKELRKAIDVYSDVLAIDAAHAAALSSRGECYINLGEHATAIADLKRALEASPDDAGILNNLAWMLATSPEDVLRDGAKAIELSIKACELTEYKKAHILSTLAAAYAETGDFEKARQWSKQAVDSNDPDLTPELREALGKELASYDDSKPWREKQTASEPGSEAQASNAPAAAPAAPREKPAAQSLDF